MRSINQLYNTIDKRNAVFSFFGAISPDIITSIFYVVQGKLDNFNIPKKTKKKVFNVLVEALQNLYHHSRDIQYDTSDFNNFLVNASYFQLSKIEDEFEIMTANIIDKKHEMELASRLNEINKWDEQRTIEEYRLILSNGNFSEKGTAGLGFIDIARKSGNKLEYNIEKISDKISFFILRVKIN